MKRAIEAGASPMDSENDMQRRIKEAENKKWENLKAHREKWGREFEEREERRRNHVSPELKREVFYDKNGNLESDDTGRWFGDGCGGRFWASWGTDHN